MKCVSILQVLFAALCADLCEQFKSVGQQRGRFVIRWYSYTGITLLFITPVYAKGIFKRNTQIYVGYSNALSTENRSENPGFTLNRFHYVVVNYSDIIIFINQTLFFWFSFLGKWHTNTPVYYFEPKLIIDITGSFLTWTFVSFPGLVSLSLYRNRGGFLSRKASKYFPILKGINLCWRKSV